uniref:hypothetical protein n=1 Tax=Nocardioides sp. SYSU DS0663 TaxID=3416445 RepID=UPI003F4C6CC8
MVASAAPDHSVAWRTTVPTALLALTVTAVAGHLLGLPDAAYDAAYLVVITGATVVAAMGARRARPGAALVPLLIALGLGANVLADVVWFLHTWSGDEPDVSLADPLYFLSYAGLGAALLVVLARGRARGRRVDVDAVLDACTIVVISVLVLWEASVAGIIADGSVGPLTRAVWAAYPVCDAVLLGLVIRVLATRRARHAIGRSFAVGVACWLGSDLAYLLFSVSGSVNDWMDLGWMAGAVLMARSAWPRRRPAVEPDVSTDWAGTRMAIAILPMLAPIGVHVVEELLGRDSNALVAGAAAVLLAGLAVVRTTRQVRWEAQARLDA